MSTTTAPAKATTDVRVRNYLMAHPNADRREVADAVRTGRPDSRKAVQAAYDRYMARMKI